MHNCEGCSKLTIDPNMLKNGIVINKCGEFNFHVNSPFLSGWKCPRYQAIYQPERTPLWKRIKSFLESRGK